jgi:hypothetical protein
MPNADAGTIIGAATAAVDAATVRLRKSRRLNAEAVAPFCLDLHFFIRSTPPS